jgi:hypothetical protein
VEILAALVVIGAFLWWRSTSTAATTTVTCPTEATLRSMETEIANGTASTANARKLALVYDKVPCAPAAARLRAAADARDSAVNDPATIVPGCLPPRGWVRPAGLVYGKPPPRGAFPGWTAPPDWVVGQPSPGSCPPGWTNNDSYGSGLTITSKALPGGFLELAPGVAPPPPTGTGCDEAIYALPTALPFHVGDDATYQPPNVRTWALASLRSGDEKTIDYAGKFLIAIRDQWISIEGDGSPSSAPYDVAGRCLSDLAERMRTPGYSGDGATAPPAGSTPYHVSGGLSAPLTGATTRPRAAARKGFFTQRPPAVFHRAGR